ncbi:MAG: hypothetical protein PHX87_02600 [Candidatus Peribacteraceae bacterium]|nr:hypothetical protein [Methanocellales archaeon]MDD5742297.1 hypothetical protein [Candidatus Peribacteraceae bacterium]
MAAVLPVTNRQNYEYLFHVLLPIMAGSLIYVLWRSEQLLVFRWIETARLLDAVTMIRINVQTHALYEWFLFSFPAGLWAYSFSSAMCLVWRRAGWCWSGFAWLSIAPSLAIGGELIQVVVSGLGTFDVIDLAFYATGSLLPFAIFRPLS